MEIFQNFTQTLTQMRFTDYVDIALVAFLIYKLLPMIRTHKIMRIVCTVAVLVLGAWMTKELQLHTLNWILTQLLGIGLLAFVVLFQPELRLMLEHLGDINIGKLFSSTGPVQEMDLVINETVHACEEMARGKEVVIKNDNGVVIKRDVEYTGAIIVFARKDHLDKIIGTGTILDAKVSSRLLTNIFFKNSPLHDKAVIIRDGRVTAASCNLPSSNTGVLSKDKGTRHHAAMGICEETDAVAVVVSEETGAISLFADKMPKLNLTVDQLKKLLRQELLIEEDQDSKEPKGNILNKITKAGGKETEHHGEE